MAAKGTGSKIVDAVTELESRPGNMVSVSKLRERLGGLSDRRMIKLADQGKLILVPYGGPKDSIAEHPERYIIDESVPHTSGAHDISWVFNAVQRPATSRERLSGSREEGGSGGAKGRAGGSR